MHHFLCRIGAIFLLCIGLAQAMSLQEETPPKPLMQLAHKHEDLQFYQCGTGKTYHVYISHLGKAAIFNLEKAQDDKDGYTIQDLQIFLEGDLAAHELRTSLQAGVQVWKHTENVSLP